MNIFVPLLTLMPFVLIGCSEQQTFAQEPQETSVPISDVDSTTPPIKISDSESYMDMSLSELEIEVKKLKAIIELAEADMDSFTEDDPRWDTLNEYMQLLSFMRDAQLAKEKELTRKEKDRTRKSCVLSGSKNC